jgi:hypothetical protein
MERFASITYTVSLKTVSALLNTHGAAHKQLTHLSSRQKETRSLYVITISH